MLTASIEFGATAGGAGARRMLAQRASWSA
jgi:hypothetical protein